MQNLHVREHHANHACFDITGTLTCTGSLSTTRYLLSLLHLLNHSHHFLVAASATASATASQAAAQAATHTTSIPATVSTPRSRTHPSAYYIPLCYGKVVGARKQRQQTAGRARKRGDGKNALCRAESALGALAAAPKHAATKLGLAQAKETRECDEQHPIGLARVSAHKRSSFARHLLRGRIPREQPLIIITCAFSILLLDNGRGGINDDD